MEKLHYPIPIFTNAHLNRKQAYRLFEAGFSPAEIVQEFPQVFYCQNGKLGQHYDAYYVAAPDLKETRFLIYAHEVDKLIAERVKTA